MLDGQGLALYKSGKRQGTIPIKPLTRIVCVRNITLETRLLHRLTREGVTMVLSSKQARYCGALTGRAHNDAAARLN